MDGRNLDKKHNFNKSVLCLLFVVTDRSHIETKADDKTIWKFVTVTFSSAALTAFYDNYYLEITPALMDSPQQMVAGTALKPKHTNDKGKDRETSVSPHIIKQGL